MVNSWLIFSILLFWIFGAIFGDFSFVAFDSKIVKFVWDFCR